jgi:hypothetical protein
VGRSLLIVKLRKLSVKGRYLITADVGARRTAIAHNCPEVSGYPSLASRSCGAAPRTTWLGSMWLGLMWLGSMWLGSTPRSAMVASPAAGQCLRGIQRLCAFYLISANAG